MCLFFQFIYGLILLSQGSPRMRLSFPHFIAWKVSLWMIPPIFIKKEAMWVTCPFLFRVPSMLLTGRGFSSFQRLTLCFFAKL